MGSFNPTAADLVGTEGLTKEKKTAKAKEGKATKADKSAKGFPKTVCALTRKQFGEKAGTLTLKVGDMSLIDAEPREFSSGSFGWFVSGKAIVKIDGKDVKCQVGCNVIVIGSKDAK